MSIRKKLIKQSVCFDRIRERFSDFATNSDALSLAIESHLRAGSLLGAIDGFEQFYILDETPSMLKVFGSAYFLPSSKLPLEIIFGTDCNGIAYRGYCGMDDEHWKALTEKKRWASMYLYATEGQGPNWNWDQPFHGVLA